MAKSAQERTMHERELSRGMPAAEDVPAAEAVNDPHLTSVHALPDLRGLVYFAKCSCGWRGPTHPSIPTVAQASARADGDASHHAASVVRVIEN